MRIRILLITTTIIFVFSGCLIKVSTPQENRKKQERTENCLKIDNDKYLREQSMKYLGTCLDLSNSYVTNSGLKYIKYYKNLTKLNLSNCYIDDNGLSQLSSTTKLEEIDLSHMILSKNTLEYLLGNRGMKKIIGGDFRFKFHEEKILFKFKKLEFIDLRETKIFQWTKEKLLKMKEIKSLLNPVILNKKVMDILSKRSDLKRISLSIPQNISSAKLDHILRGKHYKWLLLNGYTINSKTLLKILNISEIEKLSFGFEGNCNDLFKLKRLPNLKAIKIISNKCSSDFLMRVYSRLPHLKKISIYSVTDRGLKYFSGLDKLEELKLFCSNDFPCTKTGLDNLKNLKSIKTLRLYGRNITDEDITFLKYIRNLKKLDLSSMTRIKGKIVTPSALKVLNLNNTDINDEGMSYIARLTSLEKLSAYNSVNNTRGCWISGEPVLRTIDFTDKSAKYISNLINLKYLSINYFCKLTDKGLMELRSLKKLRYLKINSTKIKGIKTSNLGNYKNLRELNILVEQISLKAISGLKNLLYLSVFGVFPSSMDVEQICKIKKKLRSVGINIKFLRGCDTQRKSGIIPFKVFNF